MITHCLFCESRRVTCWVCSSVFVDNFEELARPPSLSITTSSNTDAAKHETVDAGAFDSPNPRRGRRESAHSQVAGRQRSDAV